MNKYLKVTIHDNDFIYYANTMMAAIKELFELYHFYPETEEDLERLKPGIAHMWNGFYMISDCRTGHEIPHDYIDMFMRDLKLSIVEDKDIPGWANSEEMYIPLFEHGGDGFLL